MTAVSPHPCGTARAGSVFSAGREQGAKCPSPGTGNCRHQPQGRTWRVCICSLTLPSFSAQQLDCQLFPSVVRSTLGSEHETSPKRHT